MIKEVTAFEESDGTRFEFREDAINHDFTVSLADEIDNKFGCYGRIEDIDELVKWLVKTFNMERI